MRQNLKQIVLSVAAISLFGLVLFASLDGVIINKAEALTIAPPSYSYCAYVNQVSSNLWQGNLRNSRAEVSALQNFLFEYYGVTDEVQATGFFGRLTRNYVTQFQRENSIYPITGGVGPLTRAKMQSMCGGGVVVGGDVDQYGCKASAGYSWCAVKNRCLREWEEPCGKTADPIPSNCKVWNDGCNTCSRQTVGGVGACTMMYCITSGTPYCKEYFGNTDTTPSIKSFSGPVTLKVGEKGLWSVTASSPNNQPLSYEVTWGDESMRAMSVSASPETISSIFNQNSTFEHVYQNAGLYTVRVRVTSRDGMSVESTQTVRVENSTTEICTREYLPVCGTPAWSCPVGMYCTAVMPSPTTYSNRCELNRAGATYLYDGICGGATSGGSSGSGGGTVCTADAMQCPNGNWVGRSGPNCQFVCN